MKFPLNASIYWLTCLNDCSTPLSYTPEKYIVALREGMRDTERMSSVSNPANSAQRTTHVKESITVHRMYKYRLYRNDKKDKSLRDMIFVASLVWNHFIALQRRYYRLTGQYISLTSMNKHVLKLRRQKRFAKWKNLKAQVCQEVCRRIDDAYQRFFTKLAKNKPKFRSAKKYRSFTFPQSGYQFVTLNQNQPKGEQKWRRARGTIRINKQCYHFVQDRPMSGKVKTLTVSRDSVGRLWLVFSVIKKISVELSSTGKSGGFDFGLKTFLVDDEGRKHSSPEFFKADLEKIRKLSRQLSRKQNGSKHYKRARRSLAKQHGHVADKRRDHHFKLAHALCDEFDVMYFEDLNIAGMKAIWGRKVSDLAFGQFMRILKWVALKRGKCVMQIDRFQPTTKTCSQCGIRHELTLRDRTLCCKCGLTIDRDHNAAINVKRAGASAPYRSDNKPKVRLRRRADGSSPQR